jgi:KipI family sensor histidine kinase inhibitor
MSTFPHIQPLGDSAAVIEFGDEISLATNLRVQALASLLEKFTPHAIVECLPAYSTLTIYYDPLLLTYNEVERWLNQNVEDITQNLQPRVIQVPVVYGGEFGPDLDFVAQYHNLTTDEVIRIHSEREYHVFMLGFTPGFPYLGEVDERIATPRLDSPRLHVPAGSVGIAARQTGIYPIESPGGWRIIGRTSLKLFDLDRDPPFLIGAGDKVKFIPVKP